MRNSSDMSVKPSKAMKAVAAALCGLAVLGSAGGPAQAQETDSRTSTVAERPRPDLDPLGVRAGSFLIFPSATLTMSYDDNIFAAQTGETDDFVTAIAPRLEVRSDWSRHELRLFGGGDFGFYASNDDENFLDYQVGFDGRVDVKRDRALTGGLKFDQRHEERGSPDDANGVEPAVFTVLEPTIGFSNRWNRVSVAVDGSLVQYDFDDVDIVPGGTANHDDRDRNEYAVDVRLGYEIVPEYEAFLKAGYKNIGYSSALDDTGVNRDSSGFRVSAGTRIDITGVTFGDVFVGYISQSYDDAALSDISAVNFGGKITWNASRLTTTTLLVEREVRETTVSNASATLDTTVGASVDHELRRNLILSGNVAYRIADFEGSAREDRYLTAGVSGKYLLSRFLYLGLSYDFTDRNTDNSPGNSFTKNRVLLSLRGQM